MINLRLKNYKRFVELPNIQLANIVFLVGQNNSGKSTLSEALILLSKVYNHEVLLDNNIDIQDKFEDLLSYTALEDRITMSVKLEVDEKEYVYNVDFTQGKTKNQLKPLIQTIIQTEFDIVFEIIGDIFTIKKEGKGNTTQSQTIMRLEHELRLLEEEMSLFKEKKSSREYLQLTDKANQINGKLRSIVKSNSWQDSSFEWSYHFNRAEDYSFISMASSAMKDFEEKYYNQKINSISREQQEILLQRKNQIALLGGVAGTAWFKYNILDYRGRTFNIAPYFSIDNGNADLVNLLSHVNFTAGRSSYKFIKEWLNCFDIGTDLKITERHGRTYEIEIFRAGKFVHLSSLGLGSFQIVSILIRLCVAIDEIEEEQTKDIALKTIMIFEEPELHLHPKFQSTLTDLFYNVNSQFKINFIVETHSEYMIRRSQVLVASKQLAKEVSYNPFSVFYFPINDNSLPYEMKYFEDGTFDKNFGKGFFDEASNSTMEILRMKRKQRKND